MVRLSRTLYRDSVQFTKAIENGVHGVFIEPTSNYLELFGNKSSIGRIAIAIHRTKIHSLLVENFKWQHNSTECRNWNW